jgi:tryptophan-rich sensory protein
MKRMWRGSFIKPLFISLVFWSAVAFLGSLLTSSGMAWYGKIALPAFTPRGEIIGTIWTVIFTLAAVSMALFLHRKTIPPGKRRVVLWAYSINGVLNIVWSLLFFKMHLLGLAFFEAIALWLSVIIVIIAVRPWSKVAAWLFVPYGAWVMFALYLTFSIWKLNGF